MRLLTCHCGPSAGHLDSDLSGWTRCLRMIGKVWVSAVQDLEGSFHCKLHQARIEEEHGSLYSSMLAFRQSPPRAQVTDGESWYACRLLSSAANTPPNGLHSLSLLR